MELYQLKELLDLLDPQDLLEKLDL